MTEMTSSIDFDSKNVKLSFVHTPSNDFVCKKYKLNYIKYINGLKGVFSDKFQWVLWFLS